MSNWILIVQSESKFSRNTDSITLKMIRRNTSYRCLTLFLTSQTLETSLAVFRKKERGDLCLQRKACLALFSVNLFAASIMQRCLGRYHALLWTTANALEIMNTLLFWFCGNNNIDYQ